LIDYATFVVRTYWHMNRHTHRTDCYVWTTKVVGGNHAESLPDIVAAWLSGSALVSINEVTLHRARLVRWVTVCIGG